ncbi:MAG: hypothetical protein ABEI52_09285 [Halobacteriaceae archaeon]
MGPDERQKGGKGESGERGDDDAPGGWDDLAECRRVMQTSARPVVQFGSALVYTLRYFTVATILFLMAYAVSSRVRAYFDIILLSTFVVLYSTFVLTNAVVSIQLHRAECTTFLQRGNGTQMFLATVHVGIWATAAFLHVLFNGWRYRVDLRTLVSTVAVVGYVIVADPDALYHTNEYDDAGTLYVPRTHPLDPLYFPLSLGVCFALWGLSALYHACATP